MNFGPRCAVCGITTERADDFRCATPACPCFGLVPGSRDMAEVAKAYYQSGGRSFRGVPVSESVPARALSGEDALDILERRAYLDYMAAVGAMEFEHH